MNADAWARIKSILGDAAELPAAQREAFVTARCDDPDLRREILDLLAAPAVLSGVPFAATLEPGSRLGPYVVEKLIGRGGMGEVYRARDSRLGRDVALKVLPPLFAVDRERLDRFAREARVLASLNHPHICTLYDIGTDGGTDFLVMELVDGDSLADRLMRGPMPIREGLAIGGQIADALNKAHARGIVHRDLKPGNVMLTKAGAKLLDFGLARMSESSASRALPPTQTAEGAIVGTWHYMAPEQVEGEKADARTDIWAFGCLLNEMVTGRRAFDGPTHASLIAAILERDPAPAPASRPLPRTLDHVIRRCLAKSPDDRWQSAADIRHELAWIAESSGVEATGAPGPSRRSLSRLGWAAAGVLAVGLLVADAAARWRSPSPLPVFATIDVPDAANVAYLMELSPDGRWLAYVGGHYRNDDSIWVHSMDSLDSHLIPGTEGSPQLPFWSPDAKSLGFFTGGKLKRVDIASGVVEVIADAETARGGAWSRNGTIIFTPGNKAPLFRVDSHGGARVPLTRLAPGDLSHRLPAFAEDGTHFVFTVLREDGQSGIRIGSLDRPETADLVNLSAGFNGPSDAAQAYVAGGHLLFIRGGARAGVLFAQKLDLRARRLLEEPVKIATHIGGENLGRRPFTASGGLVAYRRQSPEQGLGQMVWVQRDGSNAPTVGKPANFDEVTVAPDGDRIAASIGNEEGTESNVWIIDPSRGGRRRLTEGGDAYGIVWSRDGSTVFYSVYRGLMSDIYSKRANGSGAAALVAGAAPTQKQPCGWSSDGRLLFASTDAGKTEIRAMDINTHQSVVVRDDTAGLANWEVEPGGRFIAYELRSEEASDVYVQPLAGGPPVQVSTVGGRRPRWNADGSELYYASNHQLIEADVRYRGDTAVIAGSRPLFATPDEGNPYLPVPGGQRFLLLQNTAPARKLLPPTVIVNWTSLLKQP